VRRYREARKWSAQRLADRCAELGLDMSRATITDLENGRRVAISAAELLVLAKALDVAPLLLIIPVGRQPKIEALPGEDIATWDAAYWFFGARRMQDTSGGLDVVWPDDEDTVPLFLRHDELVAEWRDTGQAEGWIDAEGERVNMRRSLAKTLRLHRSLMRRKGLLPPELPADLAHLDDQGSADEQHA
jgi:transcriptional regulator with XRE-family HTH domain